MQTGARFGRYRLDRRLNAVGGQEVWAAYDTLTCQHVVIRALAPEAAEDDLSVGEFEHEIELAAQIHDPHVAPIHDFGQIGNRLFIVTALTDGETLQARLRSGPLPVAESIDILEQLSSALNAVRAAGLPIPEVDSADVLVRANGMACLTDVGIATKPRDTAGVHGLSTLLYECLSGRRFPGRSAPLGSLPSGLDAVIARGVTTDAAQRYRSTDELVAAARAAVAPSHKPSNAPSPAVRRNLAVLGGVALVVIVAVVVLASLVSGGGSSPTVAGDSATVTTPAPATTTQAPTPSPVAPPPPPPATTSAAAQPVEPSSAEPAPPVQPAPPPASDGVLPCYSGYTHTPPPDGPCLPAVNPAPPPQNPAPPVPQAPNVLPCYPGYQHTPPPDGPCWAPASGAGPNFRW
ncbi:protein kinase [Skermania sp. ID1734]|uniref:protein kinase n=1 Tax=Skermania sp. ID1734 TaxID=2597516 RepID=UPI00117CE3A7|nr:protein kinase [Skermania sp. ID1734]TSE01397.1 protein kinase [Skermania sp. ID1734]